jgi:hypothetical protein
MKVQHFPNFNRISALAATTLLAYAMGRFVDLPVRTLEFQLWGVYFGVELSANTVVAILVAGLTASGADWLIRQHPTLHERSTIQHWFVPGFTALVLGAILNTLPQGVLWWVVFMIGATLLLLVLVAEYIVVDAEDASYPVSVAGLTALSFALFLVLAITLKFSGTRLFYLAPPLALSAGLISLRYIYLRLNLQNNFTDENARTAFYAAVVIAIITGQLATALHYWTFGPIGFGLALLGPSYGLTNLVGNLTDGREIHRAVVEPALIWIGVWIAAIVTQ